MCNEEEQVTNMANEPKRRWIRSAAIVSGAGFTLLSMILIGLYAGYQLDVHLATAPWGTMAGALLGAIFGLWSLIRQLVGK